ncbi:MAG: carbohydrate ABC transporter permease [Chloroflexota bacterium]|nr:carbohydrate ABC transporter permease [Chloroflexota bacterium]
MAAIGVADRSRGASRARTIRKRALIYAGLCFYAFIAGLPVYWMFITTFKPDRDLYNLRAFPLFFNEHGVTFEHVALLFNRTGYTTWIQNTFLVAAAVVLITLLFCVPAGYALARLRFRGAESLTIGIFMTYLVPTTLLFLPLVKVISWLGLFDKLGALVVAYPTFTIPFCTWLMAGFFKTIPFEIEEAAMVDGCSRLGAVVRVILPLSLAGMLTVAIFAFTLSMQDFVYALTFVSSSDQKVVNIGVVTELIRGDVFYWGSLMAGALIAGVPVAILYSFFLDYFIRGITGGAVK